MGKQTKKENSNFGGEWTVEKLIIINKYLGFYTTALKKFKGEKVYIDAFAGSGISKIKSGEVLPGSPLLALKYDFDKYYFLDINEDNLSSLKEHVQKYFPSKVDKINFIHGDCNLNLRNVLKSLTAYQRGVIFLDPYAMELEWNILQDIKNTGILDVWYLFPFSAVNRNLNKDGKIPDGNKSAISRILGGTDWETEFYKDSGQLNMFDEITLNKVNVEKIREYILKKMETVFPYVSDKSKFLKNKTNSPLFLLCYALSNNSDKAISLARKVVPDIIKSIEEL